MNLSEALRCQGWIRLHQYPSVQVIPTEQELTWMESTVRKNTTFLDISAQLGANSMSKKWRNLKYTCYWKKTFRIDSYHYQNISEDKRSLWKKQIMKDALKKLWSEEQQFMVCDFDCLCIFKWQNYLSPVLNSYLRAPILCHSK